MKQIPASAEPYLYAFKSAFSAAHGSSEAFPSGESLCRAWVMAEAVFSSRVNLAFSFRRSEDDCFHIVGETQGCKIHWNYATILGSDSKPNVVKGARPPAQAPPFGFKTECREHSELTLGFCAAN